MLRIRKKHVHLCKIRHFYPLLGGLLVFDAFEICQALCHTLKIDGDGHYEADSPDEVALVQAARAVQVAFSGLVRSFVLRRLELDFGPKM